MSKNLLNHLHEADVLLFKRPSFPSGGWWISKYTGSQYSHVGLATKVDGNWYCLEFREFNGSRKKLISEYLAEGCNIDVFRCVKKMVAPTFSLAGSDSVEYNFSSIVVRKIIQNANELLGRRYGWKIIGKIMRTYIPFLRMFADRSQQDENGCDFVCSTLISFLWRKYFIDPCPYLSDIYTTPGDISRSPIFFFQFSLK